MDWRETAAAIAGHGAAQRIDPIASRMKRFGALMESTLRPSPRQVKQAIRESRIGKTEPAGPVSGFLDDLGTKILLARGVCGLICLPSPQPRRTAMQVLFKSAGPQAASMQAGIERRVRFALRRISARVPRAEVKFSDVNGPRGGLDKRCQIELRTAGARPVVVSSVKQDWRAALDEALARAERLLLKLWQRLHANRRVNRRMIQPET